MIVLWIVLGILLGIPLLLLLLSFIPVRYSAVVNVHEATDIFVRASWFLRLISFVYESRDGVEKMKFRILFFKIGGKKKKKKKKQPPLREKAKAKKIPLPETETESYPKLREVLTDSQLKTIIKPIFAMVKKFWKILRPKHINISGNIGFPCPFETGILIGAYETAAGILRIREKVRFAGEFNTDVMVFNMDAEVRGRFTPFMLALPVIGLLWQKPVRKAIRNMLREE